MSLQLLKRVDQSSYFYPPASPGHVYIVFRNNRPVKIGQPGERMIWGLDTPIFGSSLYELDLTIHSLRLCVREVVTQDGYMVPEITADAFVRVNMSDPERVLSAIEKDSTAFSDLAELEVDASFNSSVRDYFAKHDWSEIYEKGITTHIGLIHQPPGIFCVEYFSGVDWILNENAASIQQSREVAGSTRDRLLYEKMIESSKAELEQEKLRNMKELQAQELQFDAKLREVELRFLEERARRLGIPVGALAEPDLFERAVERDGEIVSKILESPHAASLLRRNPQLFDATLARLSGRPNLDRNSINKADMIIDGVSPQPMLRGQPGMLKAPEDQIVTILYDLLSQDDLIGKLWRGAGGDEHDIIASVKVKAPTSMNQVAALILGNNASVPDSVFSKFSESLRCETGIEHPVILRGDDFQDALTRYVQLLQPNIALEFSIRALPDRKVYEVIGLVNGADLESEDVVRRLNDPNKPYLDVFSAFIYPYRLRIGRKVEGY